MSFAHLSGVVFDIETLGTTPNSIIMSVGAVRVDIDRGAIYDPFYLTIDAVDSKKHGMIAEAKTIDWWSKQRPEVMRALRKDAIPLKDAMEQVREYFSKRKNEPVWAWGAHFDCPILEWSLKAAGHEQTPWHYGNVNCMRTIANVFGETISRDKEQHHNALQDAKDQAKFLVKIMNSLGESPEDDIPF